jgi:Kdo2-lipid IVA lauroyltransferase/acyltransferase
MLKLFRLLSMLPLGLMQGLGWISGWLAFAVSTSYRRQFLVNVRQAGLGWGKVSGAVGAAGQLLAELPRLWFGVAPSVQWGGSEHIDAALNLKRGIVFLTPHLGCFEVTAQAYAQRYGQAGHPMTVLFRPPRKAWLHELVTSARARPGLHTAPTTLAGVKQMIKALRKGDCVGLLPDQVPPQGQGIWTPVFGRDAYTMTLAVRLAQQTNASVLIAWGERLTRGRGFKVHVQPLSVDLPVDVNQAVVTINRAMEQLIRQCPGQYLWGYARYKTPRDDV